jgi:hypothetical protein
MKLLERFDRILSELRILFEEAAGHAEVVDKLESFLSGKGALGLATRRQGRPTRRAFSPERKEAIKEKIVRFLSRAKDGAKSSALAEVAGVEGFRLRLLLGELRAERKIRVEGKKGGARYLAALPAATPKVASSSRTKAKAQAPKKKAAAKAKTAKAKKTAQPTHASPAKRRPAGTKVSSKLAGSASSTAGPAPAESAAPVPAS